LEKIEAQLESERSLFADHMRMLRDLIGKPMGGDQVATFKTGWFTNPPRLYPGSPFVVRWNDKRVELTGSIDVLFRQKE
jgi:hypothetical protein